jgi:hypothetical protein
MAGIQKFGDDRERLTQVTKRRRSAQIDAHGMGQSFAPDRKRVGREHADATLTAGPGESGASPGFGQMQPGVRRRLMRLNIKCRECVAQNGLPPAQLLTLEFDDPPRGPFFQQNGCACRKSNPDILVVESA